MFSRKAPKLRWAANKPFLTKIKEPFGIVVLS